MSNIGGSSFNQHISFEQQERKEKKHEEEEERRRRRRQNQSLQSIMSGGVLKYHHLALTCSSIETSIEFYNKLGFIELKKTDSGNTILMNGSGLQLHLFKTNNVVKTSSKDDESKKPYNVLMDDPNNEKYAGHTHFCLGVGSLSQTRRYVKDVAKLEESGERKMPPNWFVASVFIRDPDRTVVELERNDGQDDGIVVDVNVISKPPRQGIDHVGTRVTNVPTNSKFYKDCFGMSKEVMVYDVDLDNPLKNFRPWILRTSDDYFEKAVDINLIPNGTDNDPKNILLCEGTDKEPLPGILYVCYQVKSIEESIQGLDASMYVAQDMKTLESWGLSNPSKYVNDVVGTKSIFIRDYDYNLFRLIE